MVYHLAWGTMVSQAKLFLFFGRIEDTQRGISKLTDLYQNALTILREY